MKVYFSRVAMITVLVLLLGSMGLVLGAPLPAPSPTPLPPEQWVGRDFLFLPLPADKQMIGYEVFTQVQTKQGFSGDRTAYIPYQAHVGKTVTVNHVIPYQAGDSLFDYVIEMTEHGTQEKLVGRTMQGQLEGLVLAADLQSARDQFLHQTIYTKKRLLDGLYDPASNNIPAPVTTPIGSPLTVLDVYAGIQSREPIWLIVSANGQTAVLPIAYSWTNQPMPAWSQLPPWQDVFFLQDPHITFDWSPAIWNQIETGSIQLGMTTDQVRLSWGVPTRIDPVANQPYASLWTYGSQKLCFEQERLTSISPDPLTPMTAFSSHAIHTEL